MDISTRIVGGSWNHPGPRPQIEGDVLKSPHEIKAFEVDGVRIERESPLQPIYMGDVHAVSLVGRALAQFGVSRPWQAIY